jgi:hypothetical protein
MKAALPTPLFIFVEIVVVIFILTTMGSMPQTIASHFNGAGAPNGFMSQEGYAKFMLVFAAGIPVLIVSSLQLALHFAPGKVNIPNKEYWLSTQHKSGTIQFLKGHVALLGMIISLFVAYVHWLLLKANKHQPPQLPTLPFLIGMGAFLAGTLLWGLWLMVRFKRVPKV